MKNLNRIFESILNEGKVNKHFTDKNGIPDMKKASQYLINFAEKLKSVIYEVDQYGGVPNDWSYTGLKNAYEEMDNVIEEISAFDDFDALNDLDDLDDLD